MLSRSAAQRARTAWSWMGVFMALVGGDAVTALTVGASVAASEEPRAALPPGRARRAAPRGPDGGPRTRGPTVLRVPLGSVRFRRPGGAGSMSVHAKSYPHRSH